MSKAVRTNIEWNRDSEEYNFSFSLTEKYDNPGCAGQSCLPDQQRGSEASQHQRLLEVSFFPQIGLVCQKNSN
jgi:hypothetical protein